MTIEDGVFELARRALAGLMPETPAVWMSATLSVDRAQVGDAHRRAGLPVIAGDDGRIVAGLEDLIVVGDLPAMACILKRAFGPVGVGVGQRRAHRLQADAVVAQLHGVQLHAHGGAGAAADKHLAHALDLRDLLRQDRVGHVVNLRLGHHVGGQRQDQDRRFGRIGLAVAGILRQVRRQLAARGVDRGLHVAGGGIDVAIEVELQGDGGRAQRAGRSHLVHAGDAAKLPLQRRGHGRGHGLRAGAGQPRADADDREVHIGQRGHGQHRISHRTGQQQRQAEQRGGDRALDEWCGKMHDSLFPDSPALVTSFALSFSVRARRLLSEAVESHAA